MAFVNLKISLHLAFTQTWVGFRIEDGEGDPSCCGVRLPDDAVRVEVWTTLTGICTGLEPACRPSLVTTVVVLFDMTGLEAATVVVGNIGLFGGIGGGVPRLVLPARLGEIGPEDNMGFPVCTVILPPLLTIVGPPTETLSLWPPCESNEVLLSETAPTGATRCSKLSLY